MITTARLNIIPLSYLQLITYLQGNNLLEQELGLTITNRNVAKAVQEMVDQFTLPQIKAALPEHVIFYTFWLVVAKASGTIVAELGFKGPPNDKGEIEIGYGTMPGRERQGIMTEAVGGMLEWATQRDDVTAVLASIDINNKASLRIVEKNNFILYDQKGEMLWWRKEAGTT